MIIRLSLLRRLDITQRTYDWVGGNGRGIDHR